MSHWYLIAYDIRDPKRLQRLHRYLSRRSTALQHSLYLYSEREQSIDELLGEMQQYLREHEDDLRLYPIHGPADIWAGGGQSRAFDGVYPAGKEKPGLLKKIVNIVTRH